MLLIGADVESITTVAQGAVIGGGRGHGRGKDQFSPEIITIRPSTREADSPKKGKTHAMDVT